MPRRSGVSRGTAALGSLVFLVVAPGVVIGLVPWLITRWDVAEPAAHWLVVRLIGGLLLAVGVGVVVIAFARFVIEGVGTPAPVAPTERLVVGGLYRYVRNPMYLAVVAAIVGESLLLGQLILLPYAVVFLAVVWSFVHWYEEPHLRHVYGREYDDYRRTVPGWIPSFRRTR